MATLVLSSVGSAIGGTLGGPVGAVLGRAAGSFLGNAIDHRLFGQTSHSEGNRLKSLEVQASTEGAGIPKVFGRVRLSGQVIWATRFEEVATTTKHKTGGKGGGAAPTTTSTSTTYSYFGNLAVGLCEGAIETISRVWADGKALDLNTVSMRVYRGTEDQGVDPLIAAKEGQTPAFRGTAYVVFERLPLEGFGNRLPQFSFEVLRSVGRLEQQTRAVTLIPGATEFGYDPNPVMRYAGYGVSLPENTHDTTAASDWQASLDQLQALCPNLERIGLVVAWFGTSLNAADCVIEPRIERRDKQTSKPWTVAGLTRQTANTISLHDSRPAYGSSPSDTSIVAAIADLKARGLKVTLIPFVMMDVPVDNILGDPWTGAQRQPAYPWRGRITVSPAPGQVGSPDATSVAAAQVAAFVGSVNPGPSEWSFRRFILHMANLANVAGGVDAFLLGSELRGLTSVRDAPGSYPFVDALVQLAGDVRAILGVNTVLTYGADWSEYANHQPGDSPGDLTFHLDKLWASANIDVIGIDQYQPITDWRHTPGHLDEGLGASPYDRDVIAAGLAGGENYDWFYASDADRESQARTPITDADYGEPWVYRSKDLANWWLNPHHNRVGGVRASTPTAFVPGSKPIWLIEFGAPAVDLAGNQPSAFPSDKPDNDTLPFGSNGYRDDAQQRALLETALDVWAGAGSAGSPANPLSPINAQAMIDPSAIHLWTWDARPFPAFPYALDVWSDGSNWMRGHWLNGRLGAVSVGAMLDDLAVHFDLPPINTDAVYGIMEGYSIAQPSTARSVLADLRDVFALDIVPTSHGARATMRAANPMVHLSVDDLAVARNTPVLTVARGDPESLPRQLTLGFSSSLHDYRTGVVRSSRALGPSGPDVFRSIAITLDPRTAGQIVERLRAEGEVGAQTVSFALPPSLRAIEPGDILDMVIGDGARRLRLCVDRLLDGEQRAVEAHCVDPSLYALAPASDVATKVALRAVFGPPHCVVLDLPSSPGGQGEAHNVKLACLATPWPGQIDIALGSDQMAFETVQTVTTPSTIGTLVQDLGPGPVAYIQRGGSLLVDVPTGSLTSISQAALLAGGNTAALVGPLGLEVLQFLEATLVSEGRYRLSVLVRGLGGTEEAAATTHMAGTSFVLLDDTISVLNASAPTLQSGVDVRAQPRAGGFADLALTQLAVQARPRSVQPLAPVHLRARRLDSGDIDISWTRRARGAADDWDLASVPLHEEAELFQVTVKVDGQSVRRAQTANPMWIYTVSEQAADGLTATAAEAVVLDVSQIGTGGRAGQSRFLVLVPQAG